MVLQLKFPTLKSLFLRVLLLNLGKFKDTVPYEKVRFAIIRSGIHIGYYDEPKHQSQKSIINPFKVPVKLAIGFSFIFLVSPLLSLFPYNPSICSYPPYPYLSPRSNLELQSSHVPFSLGGCPSMKGIMNFLI